MTVQSCLNTALNAGEITREEFEAMSRLYDSLIAHYGNASQAQAEMVERLMREAELRRRQALIAEDVRRRVEDFVLNYRNARGEPDPAKAMVALIDHHGQVVMPEGASSVVGRSKAILGLAQSRLEGLLHEFRRTWVTGQTRNTARLENVVREAFGEGTGDQAAADFARAWADVADEMRQRHNAAGGAIGRLEHWGLPQVHDRRALLAAGQAEWTRYIEARLNPSRMRHPLTGNPMTQADLAASLDWVYRNVGSDGWHEREATAVRRGLGAIANQRGDHRFLVFKDADAWLEYQAAFGGGSDPFAAMMQHVKGMAEDIAAMEILGPNPRATLTYLQNFVIQQAALRAARQPGAHFPTVTEFTGRAFEAGGSWLATKNPEDYAREMARLAGDMWAIYRGDPSAAVNQRVADVFGTVRNLNVASKLGMAVGSAVTDVGFQQMARSFTGLPVLRTYDQILQAFATGPKRDAVGGGLILDTAVNILHDQARWAGSMHGPVWTRYWADRVIASTGLQAWTQGGKHGFGLTVMAELARHAERAFAEIPDALQYLFRRYGISPGDWDAIRLDVLGRPRTDWRLRPTEIHRDMTAAGRADERIAERYLEMILQETEYATPVGTLEAAARSGQARPRGVIVDELWRSGLQFKMFGLSVALLQGQRIATEMIGSGLWRGGGYAFLLLITTTLYGALAMQLKEIAKGRDPRPMRGEKGVAFWGGAMLQGGGLGIYGDFLAAEQNRMGGGLARTIAGPTADVAGGVLSLTSGNFAQYFRGEKTNVGRELTRFVGQNTPGGSNWYLRLAYERIVLDQLQKMVDPEAYAAFRRRVQSQRKSYGNQFFWSPGETSPRRGPEIGRALR